MAMDEEMKNEENIMFDGDEIMFDGEEPFLS